WSDRGASPQPLQARDFTAIHSRIARRSARRAGAQQRGQLCLHLASAGGAEKLIRCPAMSKRNRPTTAGEAAHRSRRHAYRSAYNSPEGKAARAAGAKAAGAAKPAAAPAPKPAAAKVAAPAAPAPTPATK